MPPRSFGTVLSPNIRSVNGFRKDTKLEERAAIIAARRAGVSPGVIAAEHRVCTRTVRRIFERWQRHHQISSQHRTGRKQKLSIARLRYIRLLIKRRPRIAWKALLNEVPEVLCKRTLKRHLGREYKRKWRAMKRIMITKANAQARLKYARD
jgi:transposase